MKYAFTYGSLAGLAVVAVIVLGLTFAERDGFFTSQWLGYLVMLVALTLIFVGVKRYRDVERGGVIRFLPALGMGLAIAVVAALFYVAAWEAYLAATDYRFMDEYIASLAEKRRAAGVSEAALAQELDRYEWMRASYANPFIRIPITFVEIFPVGLLVALVSAALLRNPRFLPPRAANEIRHKS
ncbi:DUF4199 domain-containing protein [Sphingosinicella sp. CPCC 101087]|uniref:DUF4199 domain-containing protein n=1 Tax=Sphingosinicella sp. CPCC 101087 TaxID=2497754 RepID=UPI00101C7193|nr:DUF4199 domain-containing protein [Sphingosinicella sp. CPCC 101087]